MEKEKRKRKEQQRQQDLESELKSKKKQTEGTVSPYFKVPTVPTLFQPARNNLQSPQPQQVVAKPADKSMNLKLPTFDFGILN